MDSFDEVVLSSSVKAAKRLLNSLIIRKLSDGKLVVGKIVETEAYDQSDAASHSFRGETPRTKVMFGSPGFAYVYFTYGMHYCFNIVVGEERHGAAVLIRAVEPLEGIDLMKIKRGLQDEVNLTNGPAKFCKAFDIDKRLNGHDLREYPLLIELASKVPNNQIVQTTRIGISKDTDRKWRFYIKDNPWVSKK